MWEISNGLQISGFFRALILGGLFCFFYDFFSVIKLKLSNSRVLVFVSDIIYFCIISPITFCFLLALTGGELRGYFFISLILGYFIVRLTVSKYVVKVFTYFLLKISTLYIFFNRCCYSVFDAISKATTNFALFFAKNFMKFANSLKKLLKKQ